MNDQPGRGPLSQMDGLRAWLGEIEQTMRQRSRIALVLFLVVGALAGAALYVAIEGSQSSAPATDIHRLEDQLEALRAREARLISLATRVSAAGSLANKTSAELSALEPLLQKVIGRRALARSRRIAARGARATTSPTARGAGSSHAEGEGSANGTTVSAAGNPKLGKILVTSSGLTLYDFGKDRGTASACYGACAKIWPPLLTSGAPNATGGAQASELGTTRRSDGSTEVTYNGHPLYTYVGDKKTAEAAGNGITEFGGSWHALRPSGAETGG